MVLAFDVVTPKQPCLNGSDERNFVQYGKLAIAIGRLGSLKALFRSSAKKYRYVVICPSDGTHNHLTYFEKKSKYET